MAKLVIGKPTATQLAVANTSQMVARVVAKAEARVVNRVEAKAVAKVKAKERRAKVREELQRNLVGSTRPVVPVLPKIATSVTRYCLKKTRQS